MPDTTTTPLDLDAIDASAFKATPGPYEAEWEFCDCGGDHPCGHGPWIYALRLPEPHTERDFLYTEVREFTPETLQFFADAREKVPELVAEVRRLRARLELSQRAAGELRSALKRLTDAGETVLAEAEQAETDAVFSGTAEPKRGPGLKALREALNALPVVIQDQAVAL